MGPKFGYQLYGNDNDNDAGGLSSASYFSQQSFAF
jgi:hypothetical protein